MSVDNNNYWSAGSQTLEVFNKDAGEHPCLASPLQGPLKPPIITFLVNIDNIANFELQFSFTLRWVGWDAPVPVEWRSVMLILQTVSKVSSLDKVHASNAIPPENLPHKLGSDFDKKLLASSSQHCSAYAYVARSIILDSGLSSAAGNFSTRIKAIGSSLSPFSDQWLGLSWSAGSRCSSGGTTRHLSRVQGGWLLVEVLWQWWNNSTCCSHGSHCWIAAAIAAGGGCCGVRGQWTGSERV